MSKTPSGFVLLLTCLVTACSSSARPGGVPSPSAGFDPAGFPGFDTREYPGDAAMAQWRARSPYRWVGYYLSAPCYTGTSWTGKREVLGKMGWGTAVLYVGEQDWPAGDEPPTNGAPTRCTRSNVNAERGAADGTAAAAAARAEGFPARAVIYLDIERADTVTAAMAAYARGWAAAVRSDGYVPGLYAHARNAEGLLEAMRPAGAPTADVPLWVASQAGFDLEQPPSASGVAGAEVWQGAFDVTETWGDVTLRVDRNVASSRSPSAPR